jgi:ComF family protein
MAVVWEKAGGKLASLLGSIKDAAFPPGCAACSVATDKEQAFCPDCMEGLELVKSPYCRMCGRPIYRMSDLCRRCELFPPSYDRARALVMYTGPLVQAIRGFKYNGRIAAGKALAEFWAQNIPPTWLGRTDFMTPVPLHTLRIIKRGFNQALVLGKELYGPRLLPDLLIRKKYTKPQVGLNPRQRRKNVAGAFGLNPGYKELVLDRRVILLDDVYTTGATVNECARVLKRAGAQEVRVLTLARTPAYRPRI